MIWANYVLQFHFCIANEKDKFNLVVDALSKRQQVNAIATSCYKDLTKRVDEESSFLIMNISLIWLMIIYIMKIFPTYKLRWNKGKNYLLIIKIWKHFLCMGLDYASPRDQQPGTRHANRTAAEMTLAVFRSR